MRQMLVLPGADAASRELLRLMTKASKARGSRSKKGDLEFSEESEKAAQDFINNMLLQEEKEKVENLKLETFKIGEKLSLVVSAKTLYEVIKPSQEFGIWLANNIDKYAFRAGKDFVGRSEGTMLSLDMAKELCTLLNSQQGRSARDYIRQQQEKVAETLYGGVVAPVEKIVHNLPMSVTNYAAPVVKFPEATFTLNKQPEKEQQMTTISNFAPTTQMELVLQNNDGEITTTSLELVNYINYLRKLDVEKDGMQSYKELRHDSFMSKVPTVLKELAPKFIGTNKYISGKGGEMERKIYVFPKREAMLMAMSYSYDIQAVVYDSWERAEGRLKGLKTFQLPDFTNPAVAAIAWAEQYQAKEVLQLEVTKKDAILEEQAPKVEFYDNVMDTSELLSVLEASKLLKVGERKLFKYLRDNNYLSAKNLPYEKYTVNGSGLFQVKLGTPYYSRNTGCTYVDKITQFTLKGVEYFQKKISQGVSIA